MMKRNPNRDTSRNNSLTPTAKNTESDNQSVVSPVQVLQEKLMSRLASGSKATIDHGEMRKLTKKNYSQLPEIVQKKEKERRVAEIKA